MKRMRRLPRHQQIPIAVGVACLALVASLLLRWTGDQVLPFVAAVLASAALFGFEAGIVTISLSAAFALVFTVEPNRRGWVQIVELVAVGSATVWIMELIHGRIFRCESMLESMGDAIVVTDRAGRISFMTKRAESLLGVPAAQAYGRLLAELARFRDHTTGKNVELPVSAVLRGEAAGPGSQRLALIGAGPPVEVEEILAPLRGRSGKITGAILTLRDTTRRREAEDQLSRSQKMDALARLAGGVAGDFNNLLTVITGYGEMMRSELTPTNPLRRFSDEIIYAADRAAAVTRQLMAFSRHQAGQSRVLDINTAISSMETMLRRLLGEKIDLVMIPGAGIGRVRADQGQLEQVIVNLAMNSRDAMPQGGKFIIETAALDVTANMPVTPEGLTPGPYVQVTVSDTGMGMDAETRSRLFEPFFTTKGQGRSTGLGLSIVYGIVKQNGGDISVYSQPGAGTIFEIFLPRSKDPELREAVRPPGPRGTETILVADDDDGVRRLVHAVLATSGYTVVEATDGREALAVYQADPDRFDMVLTDVVMPHMNGLELGDRIAAATPERRILYMSGFRDTPLGTETQERARAFLHKPFTPDVLLARVREILDTAPA
jgi:two-component system, cell cycle sensor histidine kinase and response regulator CckA